MALYDLESLAMTRVVFGDQVEIESLYGDLDPFRTSKSKGVVIHEFEPDFGELETQTVCNLLELRIPPIREGQLINVFSAAVKTIRSLKLEPNRYANPECLLVSSRADEHFISLLYRYQMRWRKRLNNCLGTPHPYICLLYTSPSPRDATLSRMPSSA